MQQKSVLKKFALSLGILIMFGGPAVAADRVINMAGENPTIADGSVFENMTGDGGPGWLYGVAIQNYPGQTMTIGNEVVFQNNSGKQAGGAVANQTGGNMTIGDNVKFVGNSALAGEIPGKYANGGAIHNEGANTVLQIGDNALFQENFASRSGGAIYNNEAGQITIGANAQFIGNSVKQGGEGDLAGGAGGAIENNKAGGVITIGSGAVFTNNKANWWGGAIHNAGQLDFLGDVTFSNNSAVMTGLNDIGNEGGTINFHGGNVTLDGGIIGTGNINFTDTTLTLNIRAIDDYTIISADTITLSGDNTLKFIVSNSVTDGVTGNPFTATTMTGEFTVVDPTNTLYDIAVGDNYELTITKKTLAAIVDNIGATDDQVAVLQGMLFGGTGSDAFNAAADGITAMLQDDNADVRARGLQLVSAMAPTAKPQVQSVSQSNATQALSAVETRMSGGAAMGRSSGDFMIGRNAVWAKGLANKSKLDGAFDSDSIGIAAGVERNFSTSMKLGLGYAFTDTKVNPEVGESKIASHTVMAYGEYKPTAWFLNGAASYTFASADDEMIVRTAKYDTGTIAAQLITGYELDMTRKFTIVPQVGARYMSATTGKYTDSLGGVTDSVTYDFLTGIAGAKFAYDISVADNVVSPEIYLGATYDFQSDGTDAAMVMGNGSVINVIGESLDKTGYEVGAGLNFDASDNAEISIHYVGRFRKDYADHTGMIDLKYKF